MMWFCGACGCEFGAPNEENTICPDCGRTLDNDPELVRQIARDAGYSEEYVWSM
jgi:rRNA maturation endonuclease Nob1